MGIRQFEFLFFLIIFYSLGLSGMEPAGESPDRVRLDGYMQIRWQALDSEKRSFDIRRARISMKNSAGSRMDYRLQAEFAGTQPKLIDAEFTIRITQRVRITAGQFKIPFSRENLKSSAALNTVNRSRAVEALTARSEDIIGNQNGRDTGIRLHGTFGSPGRTNLEYTAALVNGSGINRADQNTHMDLSGRALLCAGPGIFIGGSFYDGRASVDSEPDRRLLRRRYGMECGVLLPRGSCAAEWIRGRDGDIEREGGYIECTARLIPDRLQTVLKYDAYTQNIALSGRYHRWTSGITVHMIHGSLIQINLERSVSKGTKASTGIFVQLQSAL